MADSTNREPTPIAPERCTPAGLAGADAMDWLRRAGLALLAVSAIWFLFVVFRPMPVGQASRAPEIPGIRTIGSAAASIEQRQDRLAALNHGGNIFASDRRNWPVESKIAAAVEDAAETNNGRSVTSTPTTVPAGAADIDSIKLAADAPTAIKKRLEQLRLRGVYVANGQRAAMIGQKANQRSESYRVGDSFGDGEWRLVAIDETRDRVILSRSGLNFELALYDTGTEPDAEPRASINATNTPGEVEVGFTSLDRVATELRDAGLPREQINELITLAQRQPDEANTKDTGADADPGSDSDEGHDKPVTVPPAMPPGMIQLFKAMAEGSRDVVTPPPVTIPAETDKPDKAPENSADKPDTNKPDTAGDDASNNKK